jgi:hypothetical protein
VFCQLLFAQQAAIATLESQLIQVQNAIFGGVRFTRNGNSVTDNGADKTGFLIGSDGRVLATGAVFDKATVTGIINAITGQFTDVEISGNSLFQGNITSGPLVLSNDTPSGDPYSYTSGTRATTIRQGIMTAAGITATSETYPVVGSYNEKQLVQIGYIYDDSGSLREKTSIYVYYADGTNERIAYHEEYRKDIVTDTKTSYTLSFYFTSSGKTLKLVDLPQIPSGTNVVYRDANGFLKIV